MHDRLTRIHDENLDDQEVELLDENIQPDGTDLVNNDDIVSGLVVVLVHFGFVDRILVLIVSVPGHCLHFN